MSKLTSTLQAAVVIAAVAAPGVAEARLNLNPVVAHSTPTPVTALAAPAARHPSQAAGHPSPAVFDWGDAALGAGTTLLIVGAAGAGAAGLRTRRRVRPQISAS